VVIQIDREWDVPFQVSMSVCPLHPVTPFISMIMVFSKLYRQVIFPIHTFRIKHYKINSEEINNLGETLVHL